MYATRETLTAAISHAQNVVNAAAALHTAAVARLNALLPVAPELRRDYASYTGELNDFHVAHAICRGELHDALGLEQPSLLASPSNLAVTDDKTDRERGFKIGWLGYGPEKKRPTTKAFPLDLYPRGCYCIEVIAFLENQAPTTIKITAFHDAQVNLV